MSVEIKVPSVGESVIEGTVARWLKKDGDAGRGEEPLLELETEKATPEVAAPAAGTLRIAIPEGRTVPIGSVVGRIEEAPAPAAEKRDGVVSPPWTAAPPKAPLPETARVAP